ncbi:DUF6804 family protein [Prevotella sp. MGM1]|uniref:DUF6804 family protein n=2 Tax=unclassified Prevotella TaxID=2638335 RepID=UPI000D0C144E|nr:hypothetical protein PvtlMGM1_1682 [Prevotella sp. MGM1]
MFKTKVLIMKYLKLILALMLLLCLTKMPYSYYELIRFVSVVVFSIMAYNYYKEEKENLAITFSALAILFQPFIKIALGRTIWNVVDVLVAIFITVLYFMEKDKKETI